MGQILTAAQGQNPARQASIAAASRWKAGVGRHQLCGSGLRTVALGYQALLNGDSEIVVAGGQESMSMARTPNTAWRRQDGAVEFVDTMIKDACGCLQRYHMGNHAKRRQAVPDHAAPAG